MRFLHRFRPPILPLGAASTCSLALVLALGVLALRAGCALARSNRNAAPVAARAQAGILPQDTLAARHFGPDAPWFQENIPFFECSDAAVTQIYYYRWKLLKSHLKDLGGRGHIFTEFLDDVSWSLKPFESLNDATGFHIHEARWLRDKSYVNEYIDFMYHGGNDRHFSEAIADAAYSKYLVDGDRDFALKNLAEMKRIYAQWDDHFDASRQMYFIEPLLDATEYTISSIDASGGQDGFRGGDAFRPSINSFMFANATAISKLSALSGDTKSAQEYAARAQSLRNLVQANLWDENLGHFIDRYKVSNGFVKSWEFIRGRELAGYTPWYFGLPERGPKYLQAWKHILSPNELGGAHGIRTVEPSYEHYMKQFRYLREDGIDKRECQWNGPSWPFQTTLALGGLANLLNDDPAQTTISAGDYVRLLRQYTQQHFHNGQPDLQEDYDPDTGQAIVGLNRSHHYNHSGYNDLIISGLCGLRPRADDVLEINPLISAAPDSISYFCLENVAYHGRLLTILYDRDGRRYKKGAGLSVYVDGRQVVKPSPLGKKTVTLAASTSGAEARAQAPALANLAVSLARGGLPTPSASVNAGEAHRAVDGRAWFYPNVRNGWTNEGSKSASDWLSVDFGEPQTVSSARLSFYGDGKAFKAPLNIVMQSWNGQGWADVAAPKYLQARPVENGETTITFAPTQTQKLRAVFANPQGASVALVEMKAFGSTLVAPRPLKDRSAGGLPEELPGLQSASSHSGEFNGLRWRDATDGGFFAFDVDTVPDKANVLVVKYWGGDVALGTSPRRFDILIDGAKVAEQALENNQPGQFFEATYPIPAAITKGKAKVSVRFAARPGAIAGGVFGVRVASR